MSDIKEIRESPQVEEVLSMLYAFNGTEVALAIANLCDLKIDKSGALLGRVRNQAYVLRKYESVNKETTDGTTKRR